MAADHAAFCAANDGPTAAAAANAIVDDCAAAIATRIAHATFGIKL